MVATSPWCNVHVLAQNLLDLQTSLKLYEEISWVDDPQSYHDIIMLKAFIREAPQKNVFFGRFLPNADGLGS